MFLSHLRLFRIPVSFVLLGLLALSVFFIRAIITSAWQSDQQEEALYLKSPNCFPHRDGSEVDQSLPPCQNLMTTVVAKPQNTVVDHRRSGDYLKTHRFFTLQYTNGYTQTVGDIYSDMWNSTPIGSPVSVTLWRNEVKEVDTNGYRESIFDGKKWNHTVAGLTPWFVLCFVSFASLVLLWKLPENNARMVP